METVAAYGAGPGPGVVGAEEMGVEPGEAEGVSTTHILAPC